MGSTTGSGQRRRREEEMKEKDGKVGAKKGLDVEGCFEMTGGRGEGMVSETAKDPERNVRRASGKDKQRFMNCQVVNEMLQRRKNGKGVRVKMSVHAPATSAPSPRYSPRFLQSEFKPLAKLTQSSAQPSKNQSPTPHKTLSTLLPSTHPQQSPSTLPSPVAVSRPPPASSSSPPRTDSSPSGS